MIHLIVANDMEQGEEVVEKMKLNTEDCAVLNQPHYFDHVEFKRGETVYTHKHTSHKLIKYLRKAVALSEHAQTITIETVKP